MRSSIPILGLSLFSLLGCGSAASSGGGSSDPDDGDAANSSATGSGGSSGTGGGNTNGTGLSSTVDGGTGGLSLISGGSGSSVEEACVTQSVTAYLTPPVMQFVIDRSGSMNREIAEGQTRWDAIVAAIHGAIGTIPAEAAVGVSYFPTDMGCQVSDIGSLPIRKFGSDQRSALEQSLLDNAPFEFGGTPTQDAFTFAVDQLEATSLEGPRYIVLITDGGPTYAASTVDPATANHSEGTCNGDGWETIPEDQQQVLIDEVNAAYGDETIGTFVVGAPGTEWARPLLSQMAEAGGTAVSDPCGADEDVFCHYDLIDIPARELVQKLSDAVAAITGSTLGCSYEIPAPPGGKVLERNTIGVELAAAGEAALELERADSAAECTSGWHFSSDGTHIELCGQACSNAQQGGSIDIVFKCDAEVH